MEHALIFAQLIRWIVGKYGALPHRPAGAWAPAPQIGLGTMACMGIGDKPNRKNLGVRIGFQPPETAFGLSDAKREGDDLPIIDQPENADADQQQP
jgi:hypothetical protein